MNGFGALSQEELLYLVQRFWAQVARTHDGCWLWLLKPNNGHGRFYLERHERNALDTRQKAISAHIAAWWITHGGDRQKFVDRTCKNTMCVRPDHLILRTVESRFWAKVVKDPNHPKGCWIWNPKNALHSFGYGHACSGNGETDSAHRLSYRLTYGEIPAGLVVRHKCDNPSCVRPDHLLLGTQKENIADARERGRAVYVKGEDIGCAQFRNTQIPIIKDIVGRLRQTGLTQKQAGGLLAMLLDVELYTVLRVVRNETYVTSTDDCSNATGDKKEDFDAC